MSSTAAEWGVADDIRVLRRDGYNAAAYRLEKLSTSINKDMEMLYMMDFITEDEQGLDDELFRRQLRALWTAYCLHHRLIVDTCEYDNTILNLWAHIEKGGSDWGFDDFDGYMCEMLV